MRIFFSFILALIAAASFFHSSEVSEKKAIERIEIIEKAKASSDPDVQKQAAIVRQQIDKEYKQANPAPSQNEKENSRWILFSLTALSVTCMSMGAVWLYRNMKGRRRY